MASQPEHSSTAVPATSALALHLVRHVDAEFWRWDEVFAGALCDHHTSLLVEHRRNLWRWLRGGQLLGRLGVLAALEVVGHVTIFPQEGEELQEKVAEVLADAEPPYKKIGTEQSFSFTNNHTCTNIYLINGYKVLQKLVN